MAKTPEKKAAKRKPAKRKPAKLKAEMIASDGGPKSGSKRQRKGSAGDSGSGAGDAFIHFLQSPLVADLLAVAATAALAALAEQRFGGASSRKKAAGRAVKAAGAAAAAAIGRRLTEEFDEIKKASKSRQREA